MLTVEPALLPLPRLWELTRSGKKAPTLTKQATTQEEGISNVSYLRDGKVSSAFWEPTLVFLAKVKKTC